MAATSRISDIIPGLYYKKPNDLIKFVNALDVEIAELEKQISGITDLINVDKCPDDKLIYLAGLTGCPLIGTNPAFWRRQIKSWPYILKLKGTKRSLELVLNTIDADNWNIKTFFRNSNGDYTTEKPDGEPFKDFQGVWCNSRTHYFAVELTMSKDFVERENYSWDIDDIKEKLNFWINNGKPFHSELLYLTVYSPKLIPDDHICRWDFCTWEHLIIKNYNWGLLDASENIFDYNPVIKRYFDNELFTIHDTAFWDTNAWGCIPVRLLQNGSCSESAVIANLEWGDGENALLYPNLWDYSKWDYTALFNRSFGHISERTFDADTGLNAIEQITNAVSELRILYDARTHWDNSTWCEIENWCDNFVEDIAQSFSYENILEATLSIPVNYLWDKNLTWDDYDAWENTNITFEPALWDKYSWDKIPLKTPVIEPKWTIYAEDEANSTHDADFWKEIVQKKFNVSLNLDSEAKSHEIKSEFSNNISYSHDGGNISENHEYNRILDIYEVHDKSLWDINNWDNIRVKPFELLPEWLLSKQEQQEIIDGIAIWDVNIWDGIEI